MRKECARLLYKAMQDNPDIWLLTGDLGYGLWDKVRDDFPERFINCGAAETAMMDIAVGLALSGKIPFVYSITPFLIYRPYEVLRTYINHERLNVKLIGSGRDTDYEHDGFSHDATDIPKALELLDHIDEWYPKTNEELPAILKSMVEEDIPVFLSLRR